MSCHGSIGPYKNKDFTGQRFEMLTVVSLRPERSRAGLLQWLCRCDCGTEKVLTGTELFRGKIKSCGCLVTNGRPPKDLTGVTSGRLTAEKFDGIENGNAVWICQCQCGELVRIPGTYVTRQKTRECKKCFATDREQKRATKRELAVQARAAKAAKKRVAHNFVDMAGQKFGRLTVIEQMPGRAGTNALWKCVCDCGNEKIVSRPLLRTGGTKSCGCLYDETRTKKKPRRNHRLPWGAAARRSLLCDYKAAARNRGFSWELTDEQFYSFIKQPCEYCGTPPDRYRKVSTNGGVPFNGVDRVDNSLGYSTSNAVPCCATCNHAKCTMGRREFLQWISRVYRHVFGPKEKAAMKAWKARFRSNFVPRVTQRGLPGFDV